MKLQRFLQVQFAQLLKIGPSERPLAMPVAASLAIGLPVLIGLYLGQFAYGLTASLGGLTFLYMPRTQIAHRMVFAMSCAFGMIACYALGLACQYTPELMAICIAVIAISGTMACRYFALGPAGGLFFVMAAAIGMFSPTGGKSMLTHVGLVALGAFLACFIGFIYSFYASHRNKSTYGVITPNRTFDYIVFDSIVIGIFVGISLGVAQLLNLDKPYWVPVSCLAVIQGASFRADWTKQIHCVVGTALGLIVTWGLLSLELSLLNLCLVMMAFIFIIEALVARHYGFSAIFVTPVTIFLAEMVSFGAQNPTLLVWARFIDTILGCLVGILGAACIHKRIIRALFRRVGLRI